MNLNFRSQGWKNIYVYINVSIELKFSPCSQVIKTQAKHTQEKEARTFME